MQRVLPGNTKDHGEGKLGLKEILAHRERDNGTIEFNLELERDWVHTWELPDYLPEESMFTCLSKVANRNWRDVRA